MFFVLFEKLWFGQLNQTYFNLERPHGFFSMEFHFYDLHVITTTISSVSTRVVSKASYFGVEVMVCM